MCSLLYDVVAGILWLPGTVEFLFYQEFANPSVNLSSKVCTIVKNMMWVFLSGGERNSKARQWYLLYISWQGC